MHVQLRELPGRLVIDATGALLGRIKAPMVDMETWLVETLRVRPSRRVARALGLDWGAWWEIWNRPTIDIQTGLIHAAGDAIILRVSLAELRESSPAAFDDVALASVH
jgi:sporulation protein YlmC with PRC-barrel domain